MINTLILPLWDDELSRFIYDIPVNPNYIVRLSVEISNIAGTKLRN
jgi:hypothetical protein